MKTNQKKDQKRFPFLSMANISKIKRKKINNEQEHEVKKALLTHIAKNDEELVTLVEAMIEKNVLSIDLSTHSFILLQENGTYLFYTSDAVKRIIDSSMKAWKDRIEFYENLQFMYKELVIEKHDKKQLETLQSEIDGKGKPSDQQTWMKNVTFHIVVDDLDARFFIRNHIEKIKGIDAYMEEMYPSI